MTDQPLEAEIVDDTTPYVLHELCNMFAIHADLIIKMVDAGILAPLGTQPSHWRFSAHACIRLQKAQRMRRDLGVNLAGIAVALDLLDDLEATRKRVQTLEAQLLHLAGGG
jgi:chaperone modulatory protein CbpM